MSAADSVGAAPAVGGAEAAPPAQENPLRAIVRMLVGAFFTYRGLELAPRGLAGGAPPVFDADRITSDIEQFYYVRLDARRAAPRGRRDWAVILVLGEGKYAHNSPYLRRLLDGVEAEAAAKDGRLDELIIVAPEAFFGRKNLTDVVRGLQANAAAARAEAKADGADAGGAAPVYDAFPYKRFTLDIPRRPDVAPHRILAPDEAAALLARERSTLAGLPTIYTCDPPAVWLGAREGQILEIVRDSPTTIRALVYRRVVYVMYS